MPTSSDSSSQSIGLVHRAVHAMIAKIPYRDDNGAGGVHPASLITVDADGFPSSRIVVPRQVAPDFSEIRLNTRAESRKVAEVRANPRVSVSWEDQRGAGGWAVAKGQAEVIPIDKGQPARVDIVVKCHRLEAMSYNERVMADDQEGWKPTILERTGDHRGWQFASGYAQLTDLAQGKKRRSG
ncbi:unnamed protein product [Amoebophrya sp. A25]|nr:unnamed protein product [Amoebophrya sp. A25]|eukprot:GSA25T00009451001.1